MDKIEGCAIKFIWLVYIICKTIIFTHTIHITIIHAYYAKEKEYMCSLQIDFLTNLILCKMTFDIKVLQERLQERSYDLFKGCWIPRTFTSAVRSKVHKEAIFHCLVWNIIVYLECFKIIDIKYSFLE